MMQLGRWKKSGGRGREIEKCNICTKTKMEEHF